MSQPEEDLEAIVLRPASREASRSWSPDVFEGLGSCECGARITAADCYAERAEVDLGRPRRRTAVRVVLYRCPLCGRCGDLSVER